MDYEKELILSDRSKLCLRLFTWHGTRMIDFRKWLIWGNNPNFRPTRHGVMIEPDLFKEEILPSLIQWCSNED